VDGSHVIAESCCLKLSFHRLLHAKLNSLTFPSTQRRIIIIIFLDFYMGINFVILLFNLNNSAVLVGGYDGLQSVEFSRD
jgi:hypothetical protein